MAETGEPPGKAAGRALKKRHVPSSGTKKTNVRYPPRAHSLFLGWSILFDASGVLFNSVEILARGAG
ncbi:MAG TPA: hypothetical protein VIE66_09585, partial [Methylocella sp.]